MTIVDQATLDDVLAQCETTSAAMATNLLALEETPAFVLIRHTSFTGATAQRFGAALAGADGLWERASIYTATTAEARRLRAEHRRPSADRLREIERLLTGRAVADPGGAHSTGTGLTGRTILGGGPGALTSLADVAGSLDADYRAVAEAVRTIDACWQDQLPALQHLAERLQRARAEAAALALDPDREVRDLPERVRAALTEATTDPVGHAAVTRDLSTAVEQVAQRLVDLAAQRDRLGADLAAARQELVVLRLTVERGAQAHRRATDKVRGAAALRDPVDPARLDGAAPTGLGPALDGIERRTGSWLDQRRALDGWMARARALRTEADLVARANEAPVAARDELRGRLDSYRAMAGAHGAAEDPTLTELFDRAHKALHGAPADLRAAAPLVVQYVAAVRARAGASGRRETT